MFRKTFQKRTWRIALAGLALILLAACSSPAAAVLPASPTANSGASPTANSGASLPAISTALPVAPAAALVTATPAASLTSSASLAATASAAQAAAIAACKASAALTPAVTEGPYFKAGSPERASLLETGTQGMTLTLTGYVLSADCQPVAHALLDFWQANAAGQYDNSGYTLRGHQYSDASGFYQLVTVVPGLYPGRTEHIHFKVQATGGPLLTSQLFFPGVQNNQSDGIYNPALLVQVQSTTASSMLASYNFIIATQ